MSDAVKLHEIIDGEGVLYYYWTTLPLLIKIHGKEIVAFPMDVSKHPSVTTISIEIFDPGMNRPRFMLNLIDKDDELLIDVNLPYECCHDTPGSVWSEFIRLVSELANNMRLVGDLANN
jgi:hypothetical protein